MLHETAIQVNSISSIIISWYGKGKHARIAVRICNTDGRNPTQLRLSQRGHMSVGIHNKNAIRDAILEPLRLLGLDRVCQCAANPSRAINGIRARLLRLLLNDLCLLSILRAKPEKRCVVLSHDGHGLQGGGQKPDRFVEVNYMHSVAMAEYVRGHVRIP